MTRDGESQPDPTGDAAVLFQGHERFEDALLLFPVDAGPCITDPKMNVRRHHFGAQSDLALPRVFAGVAQQVQNDLPQPDGIRPDLGQALGDVQFPCNVGRCGRICQTMKGIRE